MKTINKRLEREEFTHNDVKYWRTNNHYYFRSEEFGTMRIDKQIFDTMKEECDMLVKAVQ